MLEGNGMVELKFVPLFSPVIELFSLPLQSTSLLKGWGFQKNDDSLPPNRKGVTGVVGGFG